MAELGNVPAPRTDFIDKRTGLMSREWYRFFVSLFNQVSVDTSVAEETILSAPATQALDLVLADQQSGLLGLEPPTIPPLDPTPAVYGSFYSAATQTPAVINTAYPVAWGAVYLAQGAQIGTPTSRVIVDSAGSYDVRYSVQIDKSSAGTASVWLWARINGVNVPFSATLFRIQGATAEASVSGSATATLAANSYVEVMWASDSLDVALTPSAISGPVPAIASARVSITRFS